MPWFAVPVAIATIGLVGKLVSRHLHGQLAAHAIEDPPGVRTIAHFELSDGAKTADVLLAVAAELTHDFDDRVEVTVDAIRAKPHPLAGRADVVRISRRDPRGDAYTLELTRAWTGPVIDEEAMALLLRIHDALVSHASIRELTWHARQDRRFDDKHVFPFDAPLAVVR